MEAREQVLRRAHHLLQRGHDRLVLFQDEQPLRRVAPPAVRVREVRHELRRRLGVHPRRRERRRDRRDRRLPDVRVGGRDGRAAVVAQPPDATVATRPCPVGTARSSRAGTRPRTRPLPLLDDPVVHVGDVQRAIRRVADVHGPEQLIDARQELGVRIDVPQLGQPFDVVDGGAPDQPADRLGEQQIALEIRGQSIAADDRRSRRRREVIQVLRRHARSADASLHVADSGSGPDDREILFESVLHAWRAVRIGGGRRGRARRRGRRVPRRARRERAVVDRVLEVHRATFAARIHEPRLPIVVRREAPLPAVRARRLAQEACRRPADAERVVGRVDPVVHVPEQTRLLVLDVRVAALADSGEDDFALVGDAVAVGVGQLDEIVGVGFAREDDAVLERQDHARRHEVVGEHGVLVVAAVAFRALPPADAADRIVLAAGRGVHHVADELADVHPSVAVELDEGRADHVGLGGDELHAIAGGAA